MNVRKAIFPVGGLGTRFLPATKALPKEMLPIVDKPLIQYAVEEAVAAGIEEFIFVTGRNKTAIEDHFDHSTELETALLAKGKEEALNLVRGMIHSPGSVSYVRQQEPAGLGHAIWCARHQIAGEPVAVLLADDLILGTPALKEMIDAYQGGNMVAVMNVPADETGSYGIITPKEEAGQLVTIADIVEKPDPEVAQSTLAVVGRYIIEPGVFDKLAEGKKGAGGEIQLTDSLAARISDVPFLGLRFSGERFDCGSKLGFLKANIAFARSRPELRDDIEKWLANTLPQPKIK
jgi:UTP--glucose-1-phosphate uridylyltransferase